MAIARAILATDEAISITEVTVTSALAQHVRVFLPPVGDGTGGTVLEGHAITIRQTVDGGSVNVLSNEGNRVVSLQPGEFRRISALGDAADSRWVSSDNLPPIQPSRALATNGTRVPALNNEIVLEKAFDPDNLLASAASITSHTVTGAVLGDDVAVSFDKTLGSSVFIASVESADTVQLTHKNFNAGTAVNVAAGTLRFVVTPRTGNLPVGASLEIRGWLRRLKPDGTVGLIPLWDETA